MRDGCGMRSANIVRRSISCKIKYKATSHKHEMMKSKKREFTKWHSEGVFGNYDNHGIFNFYFS
jgi:hypothetical protein